MVRRGRERKKNKEGHGTEGGGGAEGRGGGLGEAHEWVRKERVKKGGRGAAAEPTPVAALSEATHVSRSQAARGSESMFEANNIPEAGFVGAAALCTR